jgi:hypothetical protein
VLEVWGGCEVDGGGGTLGGAFHEGPHERDEG